MWIIYSCGLRGEPEVQLIFMEYVYFATLSKRGMLMAIRPAQNINESRGVCTMKYKVKQKLGGLFLLLLPWIMCSCGQGEVSESGPDCTGDVLVPVAEFQDMKLPVPLDAFRLYAFNDEWFYVASSRYDKEKQTSCWYVYRGRVADEWEEEKYVVREGYHLLALLADREDNCYLYMQEENGGFFLEKYNTGGELLWHTDYAASQLENKGECLTDGIITEDGRVALYDYGSGGSVFVFGTKGGLQGSFTPELDSLEGIAEGQEGQIYGYCLTGDEPILVNIEDAAARFVCPMTPLRVYGGGGDGIYLCTGEGLWKYGPETCETERLWLWDDEYVQIDDSQICHISRGEDTINLTCQRPDRRGMDWKGSTLTFVSVGLESGRDYPGKQVVTISRSFYQPGEEYSFHHMEELVRKYNRQSRKYQVVIFLPDEDMVSGNSREELFGELETRLMRGEGPDLIEVQGLNVDSLAAKGAFEDLTHYYESSDVVNSGDILAPVREAGRVMGRDTVVIPAFYLRTLRSKEMVDAADWTPLRFLEMLQGDGGLIFPAASQRDALWYCMGVSLGGHFVDYEKRECYFDSEEFRGVLEECGNWKEELPSSETVVAGSMEAWLEQLEKTAAERRAEPEWRLNKVSIFNMSEVAQYSKGKVYWLGYPGWNGAETELTIMDGFVMNSASENKEGAWDFLEFLLSEELQDSIDWGFPARRDSFENYLSHSYMTEEDGCEEFGYFIFNEQSPTQEDFDMIREALNRAVYRPAGFYFNDNPIRVILEEETGMYFAGDATLEETVKKIQSRVTLYLSEM